MENKKSSLDIMFDNNKKEVERVSELFKKHGSGYSYSRSEIGILRALKLVPPKPIT